MGRDSRQAMSAAGWRGWIRTVRSLAVGAGIAGMVLLGAGGNVAADSSDEAQGNGGPDLRFPMTAEAASYWQYVSDGVMGGVSRGSLSFGDDNGVGFARLTGDVSTANNGGFIQLRAGISFGALEDGGASLTGIRIRARGNGEPYFIHLRTKDNRRPWHYYAARFATGNEWQDISLNFNGFRHSAGMAPDRPQPQDIVSIGIVAYGRDHRADLSVAEISFY